jgi:multiple sugar transport system ATP-binding protein
MVKPSYIPAISRTDNKEMAMSSIKLEKLDKWYGKSVHAVRGIDLDIADGEFMAFLGPSGCGKSSTMRIIAGLEEISSGSLYFDAKKVNDVSPKDRGVAMAFESYALYPTLTTYENLAFPLRAIGWKQAEVDKRVREIAGIMEITDLLDQMPTGMSSGQAQKVGLARALTRKPNVFVLDEPISHLDTRQRSRMRAYLKRLHIELNHTMVYVTHDQEEAMAMADRITVMRDGLLVQTGTPEEIYNSPANLFVAGFVGEPAMNFLECDYQQENGRDVLVHHNLVIPLPDQYLDMVKNGVFPKKVILGIRPFYVDISSKKDSQHVVPAEIFVVEPMGDETVVSAKLNDIRFQIATSPDFRGSPKENIWLGFDPEHILLFDVQSEMSLKNRKSQ